MRGTFTVRGVKVRTASTRRYVVFTVRPTEYRHRGETLAPFTAIVRRSDDHFTARLAADRAYCPPGAFVAMIDTTTGEEG